MWAIMLKMEEFGIFESVFLISYLSCILCM